jgi:hypothetical protein
MTRPAHSELAALAAILAELSDRVEQLETNPLAVPSA